MPQSEKTETTSLEVAFYSSSEWTSSSRSCALSKKLAWRSYPFVSRLLNHLGLISTTSIYQIHHHTQHNLFDPSLIKPGPSSLLLGDLNGHSQMWDPIQPQDQRGDEILDWILDNDLHILNDGSATRTSRITGNDSTPDISLCGSHWSAKSSWRLAEPIGNSDHLPIIIELNHKICYKPVIPRSARWRRNGVDWSSFTDKVK